MRKLSLLFACACIVFCVSINASHTSTSSNSHSDSDNSPRDKAELIEKKRQLTLMLALQTNFKQTMERRSKLQKMGYESTDNIQRSFPSPASSPSPLTLQASIEFRAPLVQNDILLREFDEQESHLCEEQKQPQAASAVSSLNATQQSTQRKQAW